MEKSKRREWQTLLYKITVASINPVLPYYRPTTDPTIMFTLHRNLRRAVGFATKRTHTTQPNVASRRRPITVAVQAAMGIGAVVGSVGGVAAAWRETHSDRYRNQFVDLGVPDIAIIAPFYCIIGAAYGAAWVLYSPILVPTSLYMKQQRKREITQNSP